MTKPEVIKLLGMLAAAYPNMKEVNSLQVELWHDCLKDVDKDAALAAIKKNILESPFPPAIADIRKQVLEVTTLENERLDGASGWGEVIKAIQKYGSYNEIEALKSMSPLTRKVVKFMSWREICLSENLGVIRGQFLRMYETVAERERRDNLLPLDFRQDMNHLAERKAEVVKKLASNMGIEKAWELKD